MKSCNDDGGTPKSTVIPCVGTAKISNPIKFGRFVDDEQDAVLVNISREKVEGNAKTKKKPTHIYFEPAGPREKIYYDPSKTKCAVVTCGGLCPGLNDVIRAIVMAAYHEYKVPSVLGIQYGLAGFVPEQGYDVIELTPDFVSRIHEFGGTVLGSSRGPQDPEAIVDALERMNVSILFMIGGDGTMRAASKVVEEIEKRGLSISVVGLPKTIDNDINYVSPSFGFDTSVETAAMAIKGAHVEATGAPWGVGLVKVMGRDAGFIAAQSALSCQEVNFCLVPEDPFDIDGENGLLAALDARMKRRGNAVIVVAEGAGQDMLEESGKKDASGNVKLRRHRRPAQAGDRGPLQGPEHRHLAQIHRPELHHPLGPGQRQRPHLLLVPGHPRGARGHVRPHRPGHLPLERTVRAHPHGPGDQGQEADQHLLQLLARRAGVHGTARFHEKYLTGTIIILDLFQRQGYAPFKVELFENSLRYVMAISTRGFVWMC